MRIEQASTPGNRAQLWVPREAYLRERSRAQRAEAIAVRLYRSQQIAAARVSRSAPAQVSATPLLAVCMLTCTALFTAMLTLPFIVPPVA